MVHPQSYPKEKAPKISKSITITNPWNHWCKQLYRANTCIEIKSITSTLVGKHGQTRMLIILLWTVLRDLMHRFYTKPKYYTIAKTTADSGFKYRKKPHWVIKRIIWLKANMSDAGCRSVASAFNRQFGHREMASKTWVAKIK